MGVVRRTFDGLMERRLPRLVVSEMTAEQRLALCRRHAVNSLAYSCAVQPDLSYHGDGHGFIAYGEKMGYRFALGDPIAPSERHPALIRSFVEEAGMPAFVQIGLETAEILSGLGYRINRMGVETVLPLTASMFSGTRNQSIRYSERWLTQRGYRLKEETDPEASARDAAEISAEWRAGRIVSRREMRFLNRPFQPEPGPDMRRFVLTDPEGHVVALLDFDPVYAAGAIAGYTTAFKRKRAGTTPHAEIALTKFAADRFREEGVGFMTLGLSPLADIEASGFPESGLWQRLFRGAYGSRHVNQRIFNLQGQAAFKRRFHGVEIPTYIAFRRASPVRMLALLRLLKTL
jgi:lysylphosphatidylglycerol synthetase-like protein (DUF2156 family)